MHADSGQGQLFRSYLGSRGAVWVGALGVAAALVYGSYRGSFVVMLAGPAAVVAVVILACWVAADRAAARNFYWSFANAVGLTYASETGLLTLTPLLGAGSRQHVEHWMYGRLPGGLTGGLGHFVWERVERDSDGDTSVRERNRFTICTVDLEASLPLFRGIYLHPRRGLISSYSDWLGRTPVLSVEVESSDFGQRYELRAATDQDQLLLRRLFAPTLVNWLAHHPLAPGFELKAGTLCVFVTRPLEDAGNLTYLIDATRHLAGRVLTEVEEERTRAA